MKTSKCCIALLLYASCAIFSSGDKLSRRDRLIFSPSTQRRTESPRGPPSQTSGRLQILSPIVTEPERLQSESALPSKTARSGVTRSRVSAYLRALRRRFGQPTADRRQGRSKLGVRQTAGGAPSDDSVHQQESGVKETDGADRDERGILFFPGNVIHSFGIEPSAKGPAVIVAEPQPGVDTVLMGGPISHPIRSLLDTSTSTVTVTTAQVGGGVRKPEEEGEEPSAPGQVGGGLKRPGEPSRPAIPAQPGGPSGTSSSEEKHRQGGASSPKEGHRQNGVKEGHCEPEQTDKGLPSQRETIGDQDHNHRNDIGGDFPAPLSERLRSPPLETTPDRLKSPSVPSHPVRSPTPTANTPQTSIAQPARPPGTLPVGGGNRRPIVFSGTTNRFVGVPPHNGRPGGSVGFHRPPLRPVSSPTLPLRTRPSSTSVAVTPSAGSFLKNPQSNSHDIRFTHPPTRRRPTSSLSHTNRLPISSPHDFQSSLQFPTGAHPSSLHFSGDKRLPPFSLNSHSSPLPFRKRPSSAIPLRPSTSLVPPLEPSTSPVFPSRRRPSSPPRRPLTGNRSPPSNQVQGFGETTAPLFISSTAEGTRVAPVCRQTAQCEPQDRFRRRCRFQRDCVNGRQCCYNRCLGVPVCQ